jgi:uncharacterized protein (DUF952 family)
MTDLLHISTRDHWREAQSSGQYRPPSLAEEGFIHCSTPEQLIGVANALYAGQTGLLLLQIDLALVPAEIKYEDCYETGQDFPHIYGPLPLPAVTQIREFRPGPDGFFILPDGLQEVKR